MPERIIRESICMSDTLNLLSDFEERFWHRLIVNCDDFGRFDARPAVLKGRLFPLMDGKTKKDMADALKKLASVGLVELYEVDSKPFLQVVTWERYQRIRAKKSKFPSPADGCRQMTANVPVFECEMRNAKCGDEDESDARTRESPSVVFPPAVAFYRDRVAGPKASPHTLEELQSFEEDLGSEVCIRAMMLALEQGKTNWKFILGILKNKQRDGIRSLAAWDAHEAEREEQKRRQYGGKQQSDSSGGSVAEQYSVKPDLEL